MHPCDHSETVMSLTGLFRCAGICGQIRANFTSPKRIVAVSTQAVLASDTFGVTGALPLGTHLVRKHDVVGATPTPPPGFGITWRPPLFPLFSRRGPVRGRKELLLALLACWGLDFHLADHLGHCTAIVAAPVTTVVTAASSLLREREWGDWKRSSRRGSEVHPGARHGELADVVVMVVSW